MWKKSCTATDRRVLFPMSPGELLEHGPFSECWQYVQLIICIVLAATAKAVSAMDAAQLVSAKRFKRYGLHLSFRGPMHVANTEG